MLYIYSDYSRKRKVQQKAKVRSGQIDSDEGNCYLLDLLLESETKLLDPITGLTTHRKTGRLDFSLSLDFRVKRGEKSGRLPKIIRYHYEKK